MLMATPTDVIAAMEAAYADMPDDATTGEEIIRVLRLNDTDDAQSVLESLIGGITMYRIAKGEPITLGEMMADALLMGLMLGDRFGRTAEMEERLR